MTTGGGNVWLQKELAKKIATQYDNLFDFVNRSKIPLSLETVRKLVNGGVSVNALSLALIAKYLGYSKPEIKDLLVRSIKGEDPKDDKIVIARDIIDLISDTPDECPLAPNERAVIEFTRLMTAHNHKSYNLLVRIAELFADLTGVGVEEALKMRLPGDKGGGGKRWPSIKS